MSKSSVFSNPAFQVQSSPSPVGFNLLPSASSFDSIFDIKPLDDDEALKIDDLLLKNRDQISTDQVQDDIESLQKITQEIRAIDKQGIVLQGERAFRARELLRPYRDGTFTSWLEITFGSEKTGHNILNYFDLYKALPGDDFRACLKKIPQKTAYIIASRAGEIDVKAEIIKQNSGKQHKEIIPQIQERLPIPHSDNRTALSPIKKAIAQMRAGFNRLKDSDIAMKEEDLKAIDKLIEDLCEFIK